METLFKRDIYIEISRYINDNEIIVIHGARQVGKTSLLKYIELQLNTAKTRL